MSVCFDMLDDGLMIQKLKRVDDSFNEVYLRSLFSEKGDFFKDTDYVHEMDNDEESEMNHELIQKFNHCPTEIFSKECNLQSEFSLCQKVEEQSIKEEAKQNQTQLVELGNEMSQEASPMKEIKKKVR